jgi:hypothetical protein
MKSNKRRSNPRRRRKVFAAAFGMACLGVPAANAETVLTGLTATNEDVPTDHGSFAPGTPDIGLTWGGNWDQYDGWPNDPGDGVYQIDGASDGEVSHTIQFAPNAGWNVKLLSLDLNVWPGGGATDVDWSVDGSVSGNLGSGTYSTADGTVSSNAVDFMGTGAETLTLTLSQMTGIGSYLAMDNLAFDQVQVPEPTGFGLALAGIGGLGALAIRRRRK